MRLINLVLIALLVSTCIYAVELNCNPPASGTWTITDEEVVCEDRIFNLSSYIISGNSSVTFNLTDFLQEETANINTSETASLTFIGNRSDWRQSTCSTHINLHIEARNESRIEFQDEWFLHGDCYNDLKFYDRSELLVSDSRLNRNVIYLYNRTKGTIIGSNITDPVEIAIYHSARIAANDSHLDQLFVVSRRDSIITGNMINNNASYTLRSNNNNYSLVAHNTTFASLDITIIENSTVSLEKSDLGRITLRGSNIATLYQNDIDTLNLMPPNNTEIHLANITNQSTSFTIDNLEEGLFINITECSMSETRLYPGINSTISVENSSTIIIRSSSYTSPGNAITLSKSTSDDFRSMSYDTTNITDSEIEDCRFGGTVHLENLTCNNKIFLIDNATIISQSFTSSASELIVGFSSSSGPEIINISGNLTFLPEPSLDWFYNEAVLYRSYPIKVVDINNTAIQGATLLIRNANNETVWNGTTDSNGNVQGLVMFNTNNCYDSFSLIYYDHTQNIDILTDTPIILSEAGGGKLRLLSYSPASMYTAYYYSYFLFNISTQCVGGYCGDVTLTLDPSKKGNDQEGDRWNYQKYRKNQYKKDIKGVIIELKDEPLIIEYTKLKQEIDVLRAKSGGILANSINNYQIKKLERELSNKLSVKKISIKKKQEKLKEQLKAYGIGGSTKSFDKLINGISIDMNNDEIEQLQKTSIYNSYIKDIHLNSRKIILLNESVPMISAPDTWKILDGHGQNLTGANTTIAIIDTGIDYTHEDLGNCSTTTSINGTPVAYNLNSPHPYEDNYEYIYNITMPGYTRISVHIANMSLEYGFDSIYVMDGNDTIISVLTGTRNNFWTPTVEGDTIRLYMITDYSITDYGFTVDQVVNGETYTNWSLCEKVVGGYDFVNDDPDPMDDQGHGTHCAGISAGQGTLKGVAPDAKLYAYKVLDSGGSGYSDDIIAGIERAMDPNQDDDFSDHVDVISMSLGGFGTPFDALSKACENAMDAGVIVVIAAGNDGPYEESIGCPGCAAKVITVGATNKKSYPVLGTNSSVEVINDTTLNSLAFSNSINTTSAGVVGRLINAGKGNESDFQHLNFSEKIALVERGTVAYDDIIDNAKDADCKGVVVYNDFPSIFTGYLTNQSSIPIVSVSQLDGMYLLNLTSVETFINITVLTVYEIVADFSSRGPSYMYNKPDVLAPGVDICAAKLAGTSSSSDCFDSTHTKKSGTSMATPHVAGAAAIIRQQHPDWNPYQIKAALKYSADDAMLDRNIQGAGIIKISRAASLEYPPPVAMIYDIREREYR